MGGLRTIRVAHLPADLAIHVAVYENLQNSRFLRKQLLDGNSDFEYAFIDARMVLSEAHILAAVFRAVNDMTNERMKSRNVHSEIVFAMGINNNISESYRKFGISDQTRSLLVLKVAEDAQAEAITKQLEWAVQGDQLQFDDDTISRLRDLDEIKKAYKLSASQQSVARKPSDATQGQVSDDEESRELEMAILGSISLRGAV